MSNVAENREKLTLTVRETAEALGLGINLTYRMVAAGTIRSVPAGRKRLIPKAAIQEYLGGTQ